MLKSRLAPFSVFSLWFIFLCLVSPIHAQDDITRNPLQLAQQLLGYDNSPAFPDPTPIYKPGDTLQFWVTKTGQDTPSQITAVLAAETPGIYLWVEQGITYDSAKMQDAATHLEFVFGLLRITDNLGDIQTVPQTRADLDNLSLLQVPDVDNDAHLFILYAQDLNTNRATVFNPNDSLPTQLVPGGFSNQHELIIANTSALPGIALDDDAYAAFLTRQIMTMLDFYNNPHQAAWLREAFTNYMLLLTQQRDITQADAAAFLNAPDTPLTQLASVTSRGEEYGAGQLFLRYVLQRFGSNFFHDLFTQSGAGLAPLDQVLQRHAITDLVTSEPITAGDVFADFVMTNIVNDGFGDGRYVYAGLDAAKGLIAAAPLVQDNFNFQLPPSVVNQLGTTYLALKSTKDVAFSLLFQGQPLANRLPIPGDSTNHFYWSGSELDQNASLTHTFDLSGVDKATLTFNAWYNMVDRWNYAYVEVSEDGGKSWKVTPTANTTTVNPYTFSYGAGFTGISNTESPRPFPYLGVGLDSDGITITKILPDGPLVNSKIAPGDIIVGHDDQQWQGTPNLLGFLATHKPGDTVNFYFERGGEFFSADVVLGTHPTRVFLPNAIWLPQQVDLTPYAGKQIQVRFAYVSVADSSDKGFALDNIAVPEIGFRDDAEAGVQGWTLNGWQQMTNELPQRFLLQYALVNTDQSIKSVVQLIGPHDRSTSGSWNLSLAANETLVLAISGLNDDTDIPAQFTLAAQTQTSS